MRAAGRDPGGGEIPMMRLSRPQFRPSPKAREVVSNRAISRKNKDLMSEAMRVAQKQVRHAPNFITGRPLCLCH
ncbi:hypothetical protein A7K50_13035 [Dehalobacter sp. MCB1]|nr:hypothetical protein A7K50_13035 [Dehalobacter sp. MCB1]TCX47443.1 hypothetical protein C1I36_14205 [Dehalobacter sp. 14DCB1]TCX55656.1 hypothetical protein C1I38_03170 [Dehalobacter sp. 12DCB1]